MPLPGGRNATAGTGRIARMPTEIRRYIRSLGIDAYIVGGAVRDELLGLPHADEDFLVPGVDQDGLKALLAPHGRVEDMEVHGQLVGVRLYPRDHGIRGLAPAGIELTPPRAERSTGPGHRDFAIVSDASIALEEDMARRDFTINAMAIRLDGGDLLDPFGGVADLERRELRTVGSTSFADDPLRIVRALRFVSQLGFGLAPETRAQLEANARAGPCLGRADRRRDQGRWAGRALEAAPRARARTGAPARPGHRSSTQVIPEFAAAIGYKLDSERQPLPLEEHIFAVVQNAAEAGASLAVRLACLLHDLAKPEAEANGSEHAALGARLAGRILRRLRYPSSVQHHVVLIVAGHDSTSTGRSTPLRAPLPRRTR